MDSKWFKPIVRAPTYCTEVEIFFVLWPMGISPRLKEPMFSSHLGNSIYKLFKLFKYLSSQSSGYGRTAACECKEIFASSRWQAYSVSSSQTWDYHFNGSWHSNKGPVENETKCMARKKKTHPNKSIIDCMVSWLPLPPKNKGTKLNHIICKTQQLVQKSSP